MNQQARDTATGSAWEPCSGCGGHGHVDGIYGIRTCPYCHGDCYERRRDQKGRFTRQTPAADSVAEGVSSDA